MRFLSLNSMMWSWTSLLGFRRKSVFPQIPFFVGFLIFTSGSLGEVRYSIPEEMQPGAVIGNAARDLGIEVSELVRRSARVVAEGSRGFCELRANTGLLLVSERMDREELCVQSESCVLQFQLLLENPLQVFSLLLDIQDINDNSPVFENGQIELELLESTILGRRFPLKSAHDPDIGANSVQNYNLNENEYFTLAINAQVDRNSYPELVLKKPLDRETKADHFLTLSGVDGGRPSRSGTSSIHIHVLDANDNVPVFSQKVYKVSVLENSPQGTALIQLNATDLDSGIYGEVSYSFGHVADKSRGVVEVDTLTGGVKVKGVLDYEEASFHELDVQAKDGGGQSSHCKLIITVMDVNDNAPVIAIKSISTTVQEDVSPGTMVALLHVYDLDSGSSGRVTCEIPDEVPFKLVSEVKNYFMLVIDEVLDREKCSSYNITFTAVDAGIPPLFSKKIVTINVTDVNDNSPIFSHGNYSVQVAENLLRGTMLIQVQACDADEGKNARLHFSLSEDAISHVSISSETGEMFTARPFDYETSNYFQVIVIVRDEGSPSLSSTCTVHIFTLDQNDNAPVVLYPIQTEGFIADEIVPRDSPAGYLLTKVIAVDADAGLNAWLSYRLLKASQSDLFSVGLHCGEIRTLRPFAEDDDVKHTLTISVSDNGDKSLSVTATVNIAIEDGLPVINVLSARDLYEPDVNMDLRLYLIMAIAAVSCLFLLLMISVLFMRLCKRKNLYHSTANLPIFPPPYGPPGYSDVSRFSTIQKDDRYNSFLTSGSWRGDFRFSPGFLDFDHVKTGTLVHVAGSGGTRARLSVPGQF